jgi:hypothetical protein
MTFRHFNGAQIEFLRRLLAAGSTTRETALTIDDDGSIARSELEELVKAEAIIRVAAYRYYIRPNSRHAKLIAAMDFGTPSEQAKAVARSPRQLIKTMIFWIIMILIPLILIELLGPNT